MAVKLVLRDKEYEVKPGMALRELAAQDRPAAGGDPGYPAG